MLVPEGTDPATEERQRCVESLRDLLRGWSCFGVDPMPYIKRNDVINECIETIDNL